MSTPAGTNNRTALYQVLVLMGLPFIPLYGICEALCCNPVGRVIGRYVLDVDAEATRLIHKYIY